MFEKRCAPGLAEPGHVVQRRAGHARRPFLPVIGDREPVCFVAYSLQQIQALTGAGQDHRIDLARQPDLLQPLGQPSDRHVSYPQLEQLLGRRSDLCRAAVNHEQIRWVGELPGPSRLGV